MNALSLSIRFLVTIQHKEQHACCFQSKRCGIPDHSAQELPEPWAKSDTIATAINTSSFRVPFHRLWKIFCLIGSHLPCAILIVNLSIAHENNSCRTENSIEGYLKASGQDSLVYSIE
ncbi:unnamed protein product [Haemonchus placei]|uniref:Uncharacterized protein n=1 Tax=Haemonchus placei TaxID=6290 RepID=A0A0N4WLU6_HAEPC|nr:unnamed protein product [Haemonchus placei]